MATQGFAAIPSQIGPDQGLNRITHEVTGDADHPNGTHCQHGQGQGIVAAVDRQPIATEGTQLTDFFRGAA
jgi:hypothetical protein